MSKQATSPPPGDKPGPNNPPPTPPGWRHWLLSAGIIAALWLWIYLPAVHQPTPTSLSYSQFLADVAAHKVKTVTIAQTGGTGGGTLTNGTDYTVVIPPQAGQELLSDLQSGTVQITGSTSSPGVGSELLDWIIILAPFLLFFWFWRRLSKGAAGPLQGVLGVGRSRAKIFDEEPPSTTFADVAGYDDAKSETSEVVDFLRTPERYARAGAVVPRGVLMVGPPAPARRSSPGRSPARRPCRSFRYQGRVSWRCSSGSARPGVRDLFAEARKRAPAIIFIDEIDAIGQRRVGQGALVANDEREQTLNQLLAEMDGFDLVMSIVVLAATNRPEVLDPALLRPGRFDRQDDPLARRERAGRDPDSALPGQAAGPGRRSRRGGQGTPGFSGADLANLANEAAIVAVRGNREVITASDFDAARDRIILGRREGSNVPLPEEKHAVAVHESGHALVAALSEHADPVAKVTILPAGQTLGVTEQLPLVERHMYGENYLLDSLAVRLGGRAAELVVLGEGSTGAGNDLAGATELATKMIREFGLSQALGPIGYPEGDRCSSAGTGRACPVDRTRRRRRPRSTARYPSCSGRQRNARSNC
jgi:cell division protease FtsH